MANSIRVFQKGMTMSGGAAFCFRNTQSQAREASPLKAMATQRGVNQARITTGTA